MKQMEAVAYLTEAGRRRLAVPAKRGAPFTAEVPRRTPGDDRTGQPSARFAPPRHSPYPVNQLHRVTVTRTTTVSP